MEIRSVTLFIEPDFPPPKAAKFLSDVYQAFAVPLQTTRIATPPFPGWWDLNHQTAMQAREIDARWHEAGADYISLGPVLLSHDAGWLDRLPEIIASSERLFVSAEVADRSGRVDLARCQALAGVMRRVSTLQANGFGNLYLAALANCPPGSPFFPVAYHGGGPAHFALAIEAADLALAAIQRAATLAEARQNLVTAIEEQARRLTESAESLAQKHGLPFSGLDFSLAPYPTADKSLGGAMEALGPDAVGGPGSLFAAAFITEAIEQADFPRCGFSGLMLPVLEDSVLAQRASEGTLQLSDLMSYSAVCGVGLDTIPLPGSISQANLAGILLDIAALASRLNKPLTARLMPLPGLDAGSEVHFDFPYFADSRVMCVKGKGVAGLLEGPGRIDIRSRKRIF